MEHKSDTVSIEFDGQKTTFTGDYATGLAWTGVANGDVKVKTHTDNLSNLHKGYKLLWRRVPFNFGDQAPVFLSTTKIPFNGSDIIWFPSEDRYGIFDYSDNVDDTMVIESDGVSKIQLAFSEFYIEKRYDYVEITFDGHTTRFEGHHSTVVSYTLSCNKTGFLKLLE